MKMTKTRNPALQVNTISSRRAPGLRQRGQRQAKTRSGGRAGRGAFSGRGARRCILFQDSGGRATERTGGTRARRSVAEEPPRGAHLTFLHDDPSAGVAALEPRESGAAAGHVVAPLQRGYVSTAIGAAKTAALPLQHPGQRETARSRDAPPPLTPANFPLANFARALCFRPLSPCKRPKSPLPSASS
jgi:hypothetical protein